MKIKASPPRRTDLPLLILDLIVVSLFVSTGLIRHGVNPIERPSHAALVITPFLIGWLIISSITGIYRARETQVERYIGVVSITWIIAGSIGLALRSTSYLPGNAPPAFIAVMLGFGLISMTLWRLAYLGLQRAMDTPDTSE